MNRKTKRRDGKLVRQAIALVNKTMKDKRRHDGVTTLNLHPLTVFLILRDLLRITDEETLAAAVLHDSIEDSDVDYTDIEQLFGDSAREQQFGKAVRLRVEKQTHTPVSESVVPDPEERRKRRYRKKLKRVPAWDTIDCLVSLADILANLFKADGTIDRVMIEKPPYWNWALHEMLPALDRRLGQLGWPGLRPGNLVTRACRYCGPLPMFDTTELQRLDAIV